MKKSLLVLSGLFFLLLWTGAANAELITIGTASFDSDNSGVIEDNEHYNLIYHADGPFGSIVWLDYTNDMANWWDQNTWAAELDSDLSISLLTGYSVAWEDSAWRLPSTVDKIESSGHNITSSEMGHLFYTELCNLGYRAFDGSIQPGYGLKETGPFDNLGEHWYWSGTEFEDYDPDWDEVAWFFGTFGGSQNLRYKWVNNQYGIAVRSGTVSVVPEPTTMLLFGAGLLGIAGINRKRKKSAPHIA